MSTAEAPNTGQTWEVLYSDKRTQTGADQLQAMGLANLARKILLGADVKDGYVSLRDDGTHYTILLEKPVQEAHLQTPSALYLYEPIRLRNRGNGQEDEQGGDMEVTTKVRRPAKKPIDLSDMPTFDFDSEQNYAQRYRENRNALKLGHPISDEFARAPHRQLPLYRAVRSFKLADNINRLARYWHDVENGPARAEVLRAMLSIFGQHPNGDLASTWQAIAKRHGLHATIKQTKVSQLQITSGIIGKGANREKADGTVNEGKPEELWLIEWLRVGGFFSLAVPTTIRQKKDASKKKGGTNKAPDRKMYILRPQMASLNVIDIVLGEFRSGITSASGIKLDILATLHFVRAFYETHKTRLDSTETALVDPAAQPPARCSALVHGFDVITSNNMGSNQTAYATMNLAMINVPNWLPEVPLDETPTSQREAVEAALKLVRDHIKLVRQIGSRAPDEKQTDENSEEMALLAHYRDFVCGRGGLSDLLRFTDDYGPYVISQWRRGRQANQLATGQFDALLKHFTDRKDGVMANDPAVNYRLITTSIGFRNIAACVRNATTLPQLHKLKAKASREHKAPKEHLDSPFEVRYGLSHTLNRAALNGDEDFLRELGDFLTSYRQESLRVLPPAVAANGYSKSSPKEKTFWRPNFTTEDVAQLVDLVYEFKAPVVCSLLLAYGYARDQRDPATPPEPTSDESPALGDEDEDDDDA